MVNKKDLVIDQLKHYLTLQLEAYLKKDQLAYSQLEKKILEIEKEL